LEALFVIFCIVGSILGIQTVYFIEKEFPYLLIQGQQRTFSLEVYFFFLIGTPSLASFYNRTFPFSLTTCTIFPILEKGQSSRNPFGINKDLWMSIKEKQPVEICIAKGGLGFEFVKGIYLVH
jgi:hypothetical protein